MNLRYLATQRSTLRAQLFASSVVAVLITIPIALMMPMYMDDYQRALSGKFAWTADGRPLAELIYKLFLFDSPRTALISPLGLLLCIPLISLSSIVICRIFGHRNYWAAILSTFFIFCQPYFLENLSYSFDAPLMVLAILLALVSALLVIVYPFRLAFLFAVFLNVCSLALYQPANVSFWIPTTLSIVFPFLPGYMTTKKKIYPIFKIIPKQLLHRNDFNLFWSMIFCQLISFLTYKVVILNNVILKSYTTQHADLAPVNKIVSTLLDNIYSYMAKIFTDWNQTKFGFLFLILIVSSIIIASFNYTSSSQSSLSVKFKIFRDTGSVCLRIFAASLIFLISYGVPIILLNPVFPPRTFIGLGIFTASLILIATRSLFKIEPLSRVQFQFLRIRDYVFVILIVFSLWSCLYILFAYVNAYTYQTKLDDYYISSIVSDLRQAGYSNTDFNTVKFTGKLPYSPVTLNTYKTLPYLKSFVKPLQSPLGWPHIKMRHYGFDKIKLVDHPIEGRVINSNPVYKLSTNNDNVIIKFK